MTPALAVDAGQQQAGFTVPPLFWQLLAWLVALLVLVPVLVLLFSWSSNQSEFWVHLVSTELSRLLGNTVFLMFGVAFVAAVLGVGLAWLTAMCEFPGRRWLDWALVLPMAMPAYVLAFTVLGIFDFAGPFQKLMSLLGMPLRFDPRQPFVVVLILAAVLYPYVYLMVRTAFLAQGGRLLEAARVLGVSPTQAFFRVALPMVRPAIVAGLALVVMETLADFGAVAVFNFDTFTTAIYKAWFGFFNLQAAAQLATLLLLFVVLGLAAEKSTRDKARFDQQKQNSRHYRLQLKGGRAVLATTVCCLMFLITFCIPVIQLLVWVFEEAMNDWDTRFTGIFFHTLMLGLMASSLAVFLALLLAFAKRQLQSASLSFASSIAGLGYALPGSVLAVGVALPLVYVDRFLQAITGMQGQILMGSVLALLVAYVVRFFRVAQGPVNTAMGQIKPSVIEAARSLGAGQGRLLREVYLPVLRPGLLTAGLLVMVDVMKEMPATLLMRPFGWDTLAVRIFELTSEGEWARAALPSLCLMLVGLIPVFITIRRLARF